MKKLLTAGLCLAMVASLTGCGSNNEADKKEITPTKQAEATPTTEAVTPAQDTQVEATTPEESSAENTKLSGKVTVYCPSPAGLADKIAEAFTAKTGVEVEMFQGTTGEILARLETEKENPVADVVIMASWADGLGMINDDLVLSYEPENADKMQSGWVDDQKMIYGYSASAVGVIYNTTSYATLNADWSELGSNAEYKDDIAIPDPVKSGACKDFLCGYINHYGDEGQSVIDSWVSNGLTNPGANKAALEAVTTGEKGILIAGVDYNAYSSIDKGEPLGIYYPAGGTVINPRPAMILKSSSNVENAKAYMDFLLSDEGQQLVCDAYLLPGRNDITTEKRTNVSDIPVFDIDWTWMMEHSEEISTDLVEKCK